MTKEEFQELLNKANEGDDSLYFKIGECYLNGDGTTKDIPSAISWYTKGADKGIADCMAGLGFVYLMVDGYQDLIKASEWYSKASDLGHVEAKYNLANIFFRTLQVTRNKISESQIKKYLRDIIHLLSYNLDYNHEPSREMLKAIIQPYLNAGFTIQSLFDYLNEN